MGQKGIALAYLTALASGFAVFANSFGVVTLDSTIYTFLKNSLVAVILASLLIFLGSWKEFLSLNRKQAIMLIFIGIAGGGIAFALFFAGLSGISGAAGSFLYRLLFLFAIPIGFFFLKEKFSPKIALGACAMLAGNFLLLGGTPLLLNEAMLLVLCATVLWAIEYAVSKKALQNLSPLAVASARMGIGSIVLLAILAFQGKIGALSSIPPQSILWIAIATGFLLLFVTLWYSALKHSSLITATAVFTLGGPVSAFLSLAFAGKALAPMHALGFLLLALGAVFIAGVAQTISSIRWTGNEIFASLKARRVI